MPTGSAGRGDDGKTARLRREDERIRGLLQDARESRARGEVNAAIRAYERAANLYASRDEPLKGVALLGTAHDLDPNNRDVLWRSAELLAAGGRSAEALAAYESLAVSVARVGDIRGLLELHERIVALQPDIIPPQLRLAELYSREGHTSAAIEHFRGVASRLLAAGHKREYLRVAERLLFHDADDIATTRDMARVHVECGETRRALVKLKALLRLVPGDAIGLELLGEALIALGRADKALLVALESARVQRTLGLDERRVAARLLRRAIDATPGEESALRALQELDEEIERLSADDPELLDLDEEAFDEIDELDHTDVVGAVAEVVDVADGVAVVAPVAPVADVEGDGTAAAGDDASAVGAGEDAVIDTTSENDAPVDGDRDTSDKPRTLLYSEMPPSVVAARRDVRRAFRRRARVPAKWRRSLEEARVFARNDMLPHALSRLEELLAAAPEYADALVLQGELLEQRERYADAAVAYARAEQLLSERDPKRALELAARLVALRFGRASDGSLR